MTRTIGTNPVTADRGTTIFLMRINYWNVTQQEVRLTDAPVDLTVDVGSGSEVWTGTGLLMNVSQVSEGADMDVSGIDITFDGVDQTVMGIILNNQFRGQPIEIYKAWYDTADGLIEGTPLLYFKGYQNEPYSLGETSTDNPDAVSVSTRAISLLTKTTAENVVLANPTSHFNMLQRFGTADTTANFWALVPTIVDIEVSWGEHGSTGGNNPHYTPPDRPDEDDRSNWDPFS